MLLPVLVLSFLAVHVSSDVLRFKPHSERNEVKTADVQNLNLSDENLNLCPDRRGMCPSGQTCCKGSNLQYSCCQYQNAVCCRDRVHCCPSGSTCDMVKGTCIHRDGSVPWVEKIAALKSAPKSIKCDSRHECPDGSTCCQTSSGEWGCCPLVKAVCCSDHIHCCPSGTTCDVGSGTCDQGGMTVPWVKKQAATTMKTLTDLKCDAKAVSCADDLHCCPKGMTCNAAEGTCIQDSSETTWSMIMPNSIKKHTAVRCGDKDECPDGSTCCSPKPGHWECCPVPKAVCCIDGIHCCPEYTVCNLTAQKCEAYDGAPSTPLFTKEKSRRPATVVADVQCDPAHYCPDGSTCCKMTGGEWGCCPLPMATCCSDHIHCCPQGTTCDVGGSKCNQGGLSVPWVEKVAARKVGLSVEADTIKKVNPESHAVVIDDDVQTFICNGTKTKCNDGDTCCKTADGRVGCCVYSNAVCCSDGTHCCPQGTTCQVETGLCLRKDGVKVFANRILPDPET